MGKGRWQLYGFGMHTNKWLFRLVFIVIVFCGLELSSFLFIKALDVSYEPADVISKRHADIIGKLLHEKSSYLKFSPELGWTIREYGKNE
jgi:hypothetical protein